MLALSGVDLLRDVISDSNSCTVVLCPVPGALVKTRQEWLPVVTRVATASIATYTR